MASWFDSVQREALAAIERTRSTIDRALDIEEPLRPTAAPAPKQPPSAAPIQQPAEGIKPVEYVPAKPMDAPTPQKPAADHRPPRQPAAVAAPQQQEAKQKQHQQPLVAEADPFFAALLPPGSSGPSASIPAHPTPKHPDTPAKPKTAMLDSSSKPKAAKVGGSNLNRGCEPSLLTRLSETIG